MARVAALSGAESLAHAATTCASSGLAATAVCDAICEGSPSEGPSLLDLRRVRALPRARPTSAL